MPSREVKPRGRWATVRAERRREAILEEAWEVFRERGYDGATLDEIAERLMMTKANLYYYVKNKAELFLECHRTAVQQLIEGLQTEEVAADPPVRRFRRAVRNHVERVNENTLLAAILLRHDQSLTSEIREEIRHVRQQYEEVFLQILRDGVADGSFRIPDLKLALYTILGALNWVSHWYREEGRLNKQEVAERIAGNLLDGIAARVPGEGLGQA